GGACRTPLPDRIAAATYAAAAACAGGCVTVEGFPPVLLEPFLNFLSAAGCTVRSEEHTSELQSRFDLVCRLLLEKKKTMPIKILENKTENKATITNLTKTPQNDTAILASKRFNKMPAKNSPTIHDDYGDNQPRNT